MQTTLPAGAEAWNNKSRAQEAHSCIAPSTARRVRPSGALKTKDNPNDKRHVHALSEQRYRENINARIWELHEALARSKGFVCSRPLHGEIVLGKMSKNDILWNAIRYINETEVNMRHMECERVCLEKRIQQLELTLQQRGLDAVGLHQS